MSEIGSFEPADIFATIEARPPLMRKEAAASFIGREVNWTLTFSNGSEERPGQAWLIFRSDPHNMRMVAGYASLADHPSLKTLQRNETVLVSGWVRKIDALYIELEIRDLVFAKAAAAAD